MQHKPVTFLCTAGNTKLDTSFHTNGTQVLNTCYNTNYFSSISNPLSEQPFAVYIQAQTVCCVQ